jgi:hypothetical protein
MTSTTIRLTKSKKLGDRRMRRQRHLSAEMFRTSQNDCGSNDSRTVFVSCRKITELWGGAAHLILRCAVNYFSADEQKHNKNGWQNSRHSSRRPRSIQTGSSSFSLDWKIMEKNASENSRKHLGGLAAIFQFICTEQLHPDMDTQMEHFQVHTRLHWNHISITLSI